MFKVYIFLILLPFFSISQIVSYELQNSWSIFDVQDLYTSSNLPDYIGEINYDVEGYKVLYYTPNEDGDLVLASGAVFLPVNTNCDAPILSWQHGTVVSDMGVPSQNIDDSNVIGIVSASHGYVVVMSDYLGLGEGEGIHNYCHSDTESSAVVDLIIQGKNLANTQGVNTNNQLFLMGYSQGGHATMATVKEIEANFSNTLSITASAPMAGPYSMSIAQTTMLDDVYPNPGYFPYVIYSYQNVYDNIYDSPIEIFKPGFENIFDLYDGTYSMTEINEEIWSIGQELYDIDQSEFIPLNMLNLDYFYNYSINEDHPFRIALQDNDLLDFIPQSPMRLIHCNGDDNVPYDNSVMAFDSFSMLASEELVLLDGGTFNHSECASFAIQSAKIFFDSLAEFCSSTFLLEDSDERRLIRSFDSFGRIINPENSGRFIFSIYDDGFVKKNIIF